MGHLGITFDDPNYFAVQVMNRVMSGGFASRFFSNIRSNKGLAYNGRRGSRLELHLPGDAHDLRCRPRSESMAQLPSRRCGKRSSA